MILCTWQWNSWLYLICEKRVHDLNLMFPFCPYEGFFIYQTSCFFFLKTPTLCFKHSMLVWCGLIQQQNKVKMSAKWSMLFFKTSSSAPPFCWYSSSQIYVTAAQTCLFSVVIVNANTPTDHPTQVCRPLLLTSIKNGFHSGTLWIPSW